MPHDENNPLLNAFARYGINIDFRANAASFPSFTAALEDPSRIVEWDQIQKAAVGGVLVGITREDHLKGYGGTEDEALAGLKKLFWRTAAEDSYLLIRTSESPTGARYVAVKSDGADDVRNMGFVVTERTDTGSRVREIALKR